MSTPSPRLKSTTSSFLAGLEPFGAEGVNERVTVLFMVSGQGSIALGDFRLTQRSQGLGQDFTAAREPVGLPVALTIREKVIWQADP